MVDLMIALVSSKILAMRIIAIQCNIHKLLLIRQPNNLILFPLFFFQSRSIEASRNSRSMENLDHHHGGAVPSSYNDQQRSNNSNIKSGNSGSKSGNSGSAENSQTGGQSGNNVKPSQVSRRNRQENQKNPETENHHNPEISGSATTATGQRKSSSSSSSKKENRKSTPAMTGNGNSSHGSPSRQQQQQQATSGEKSGSGGKRRDHPSGVGAVGGRGSILHNTVNPLLTEVSTVRSINY